MNKKFKTYVAASFPIIWVDTCEYDRAINELSIHASELDHECCKWDILSGLKKYNNQTKEYESFEPAKCDDPTQPIQYLESGNRRVVFVQDYHIYLQGELYWQRLLNDIKDFNKKSNIFVIVSPVVRIPAEIIRYVTVMDFDLPDKEILGNILIETCKGSNISEPSEQEKEAIINSGLGLTAYEFENALYLSIVKYNQIKSKIVNHQKEQLVRQNSTLEVTKFDGGFETLEGLDVLKAFCKKMVGKGGKGVLLLGVPGGGKSHFIKTLGNETNRITIALDFGKLMGGIVGETEKLTKQALQVIDTAAPAILQLDEIEKGLAGTSGYNGDSGTSRRQGGQFLQWMNDHTSDVYIVATANNIEDLPPEFLRAERWDAIFFIDFPNDREKEAILNLYKKQYNITDNDYPDMTDWTGAEIKTLCRLASGLEVSLKEASKYVCPIYKTMSKKIQKLREFAKTGGTIFASLPE